MQPPFSRWYNPDKRCDVMVGSSVHFNWIIARIESGSWWAKDERNLWRSLSSIILSPEHPQNDEWSELLGKTQILPEKMIQEWQWIVNHIAVQCRFFLFCDHISSLNETCLSFAFLFVLKSRDASFKGYFYKIFWSSSNMRLWLINPED